MTTGTLSIDIGKEVHCMTPVQNSGFVGSEIFSLIKNVHYKRNFGAGDADNEVQAKFHDVLNTNKEIEAGATLQEESVSVERFVSVLDKRRITKRTEEDGCEWKPPVNVHAETVSSKVDSLISTLRVRFNCERQARKDTTKSTRSQYIFCNSVDAFLRHHEKPKVDIHYSETEGCSPEEGLYSFAVRPSRIKKGRKDTFATPQPNTNVYAVSSNAVIGTRAENCGDEGSNNSTRFINTVSAMQNADASGDVFKHKNTVIWKIPSLFKAPDYIVTPIVKCNNPEDVNSHVISPVDTIRKSESVNGCSITLIKKKIGFAELLPIFCATANPSNPYSLAIVPIYKVQSCLKASGHAVPLMHDYHVPEKNCDYVIQTFPKVTFGNSIPSMLEYHSSDKNYDHTITPSERANIVHAIPLLLEYYSSQQKNGDHVISPFQGVSFSAEIDGSVYKIDILESMTQLKRRICDTAKHYKKPTLVEICGRILRLIPNVPTNEELSGDSVLPIKSLIILGEVYSNIIHITCTFHTLEKAGTEKICEMPVPSQLILTGIKEIYGHALSQIRYMLTAKEYKTFALPQIHMMTLAVDMYGHMLPKIYKVGGYTYKEKNKSVCPVTNRTNLEETHDNDVTPVCKTLIPEESYSHMFPLIYKSESGKVHDYEKGPIDNVSTTGNVSDNVSTTDSRYTTVHEVHAATSDTLIDEYDDDSLFGILSVYCNSEIHSR
ncbi:uncharacterized protein LOC123562531 [Mercenaria mercenaria]|uniref:uncharacterized protein LOC123562531 n=1 Tax=Mercenaria mercenaria TaxID=6596 RepID=UPI001E1D3663|nr:uncharacterized protein LOC123562531 [Mercenaria mercenaria]